MSSFGILSMVNVLVTFLVSPGFIAPKGQGNVEMQSPEFDWKMMMPLTPLCGIRSNCGCLNETPAAGQGPLFVTTA